MTKRPTIADLARIAGVSVSTVDRVINGRNPVRRKTAEKVQAAAQQLGFHATGLIVRRLHPNKPAVTMGFLLLQKTRPFYRIVAEALGQAAAGYAPAKILVKIVHVESLEPSAVASGIERLGQTVDALAVVAANHPLIASAINLLHERGVPVFGLISEVSADVPVGYVGLDNFKAGRTAAWAIANLCREPGPIGVIVGSHRFRCQDLNEMGFRSYFREHAPEFALLEPVASLEDAGYAAEITRELLLRSPKLAGLYVAGGGVSGVISVLRESGRSKSIVAVGHDLTPHTRSGLIDGSLKMIISHPIERMARCTIEAMFGAIGAASPRTAIQEVLPFDLQTPESI
jgi:LacI family transcriptional regulator